MKYLTHSNLQRNLSMADSQISDLQRTGYIMVMVFNATFNNISVISWRL